MLQNKINFQPDRIRLYVCANVFSSGLKIKAASWTLNGENFKIDRTHPYARDKALIHASSTH